METGRSVFVVFDTLGAGRIVGVFGSRKRAEHVAGLNPSYYRFHECPLNAVNPDALGWAQSPEIREQLETLLGSS